MTKLKKLSAFAAALVMAFSSLPAGIYVNNNVSADELLGATDFNDGIGLPWTVVETAPADADFEIADGVYKITVNKAGGDSEAGKNCRWDVQFRHRDLQLEAGHTYTVKATVTASNNCTIYTKIGDMDEPYEEDMHGAYNDWAETQITAGQPFTLNTTFTANRSAKVEWAFHIGGHNVPDGTVFTFDDMSLFDPQYTAPADEGEWQRAGILVNQLGYFSNLNKKATLVSDSSSAVDFELKDSSGKTVYSGKSIPMGNDKDSGDSVHILDFSDYDGSGSGYTLVSGDSSSWQFDISDDLYSGMLKDALNYFYQNRSGIDIESQYISSGNASALARSAGHNPDVASTELVWGYKDSYSLDVTGGWYDAGDHGKYVVNGGISVWTLQNQYERTLYNDNSSSALYADNSMNIPESGNNYPDLLDETRYELEFMLKMIVPDGYEYAGMVHHKIHDDKWTALGVAPADDTKERILKPPTTAATLNLSAVMAQAYRLWKDYDSEFAQKCLDASVKAYEAAKKHPDMYAPFDEAIGGGAYGDNNVTDEFYWAACELYLATGESSYHDDIKKSDYYLQLPVELSGGEDIDSVGSMDWGNTAALGSLSLVLVKDGLDDSEIKKLTDNVVSASEYYISLEQSQGYGIPLAQSTVAVEAGDESTAITGYPWGSNSFVANNAIIMAYAYDLTGDSVHLNGVISAMDYLLGRNPLDYSYVTGYGYHAVKYPHHRWWANPVDDSFPSAPDGVLVGGPNSGLQDPWVKGSGWNRGEKEPQLCYMDNIEAWSTNECTINWNAPLAWLAGYFTPDSSAENSGVAASGSTSDEKVSSKHKAPSSSSSSSSSIKDILIKILAGLGAAVILVMLILGFVTFAKGFAKGRSDSSSAMKQKKKSYSENKKALKEDYKNHKKM